DSSVHSTVAGLGSDDIDFKEVKKAQFKSTKNFGSFGNLRRSLPRIGRSVGSFKSQSTSSLSSAGSLDPSNHGSSRNSFGTHRAFSQAERRDIKALVSHSFDTSTLSYGVAQAIGRKDQDRYDIRLGNDNGSDVHFFGVFDGHGTSALAADFCVDRLYDEVGGFFRAEGADDESANSEPSNFSETIPQEPYAMPSDEAIIKGFLKIDDLVRASRHAEPRSGACAVTMFVEQEEPGNSIDDEEAGDLRAKVAWVGDCRCIMITSSGDVEDVTLDHRVEVNEPERERILNADHTPREGLLESEVWAREVERAEHAGETPRPHSFIGRRMLHGVPTGSECVFSHSGGVSLQVTRSIGDVYAARSVIAEPDVVSFSIPRGEHTRFVLASDGVFEAMDSAEVAKFVSKISSAAKATAKLAAHAKQKRLYAGMAMDDITAIVVDINPETRKKGGLTKGGSIRRFGR
ncbi:Probable protein phosphatase 2C 35 (AtPP2C35), partial [Durusdinium trenchii]